MTGRFNYLAICTLLFKRLWLSYEYKIDLTFSAQCPQSSLPIPRVRSSYPKDVPSQPFNSSAACKLTVLAGAWAV